MIRFEGIRDDNTDDENTVNNRMKLINSKNEIHTSIYIYEK